MGFSKFALHDAETMFDSMDVDKSGAIDADEIGELMSLLEIEITPFEIDLLLETLDADNSGSLELPEIRALFRAAQFHAGRKLADSKPGSYGFPAEKIFDTTNELERLVSMRMPPMHAERLFTAVMMLTQPAHAKEEDCNWGSMQACRLSPLTLALTLTLI